MYLGRGGRALGKLRPRPHAGTAGRLRAATRWIPAAVKGSRLTPPMQDECGVDIAPECTRGPAIFFTLGLRYMCVTT